MVTRSVYEYEAAYPLYGLSFSPSPISHRIALTSLITGPNNKLSIVELDPSFSPPPSDAYYSSTASAAASASASAYRQTTSTSLPFPASKVAFGPNASAGIMRADDTELLATSGDVLRIWELGRDYSGSGGRSDGQGLGRGRRVGNGDYSGNDWSLQARSVLTSSKSPSLSLPPITSFAWNTVSPERIVSCSIDTTATLWDIETSQAVTQLIAHDRAVYDLSWLPDSSDIFVSVGADGSLRAFDLRQLEHSTILYESPKQTPLARIAFSNREQHMLACFGVDDSKILILDMRSPGQPVAELVGHQGPLSAIAWGSGGDAAEGLSTGGGWIASCADDGQLLMYDLTQPLPDSRPPSTAPSISNGPTAATSATTGAGRRGSNSLHPNSSASRSKSHSNTHRAQSQMQMQMQIDGHVQPHSQTQSPASASLSPPLTPSSLLGSDGKLSPAGGIGSRGNRGDTTNGKSKRSHSNSSHASVLEIMPARAWSAGGEISNLALDGNGDWVGCVSGGRLSVLRV